MFKPLGIALVLLVTGCGQHYVMPDNTGAPQKIVVSAYTNDGCIENLNEEAAKLGVRVKLTNVTSDLGWGILLLAHLQKLYLYW